MALEYQQATPLSLEELDTSLQEFNCPECGADNPWAQELLTLRSQVITDPLTGLFNVRCCGQLNLVTS